METVIIIGAGASGLMAALTASEDKARRVIVLERQQRAGRKLLATGNGRCNLTNTGATLNNYHGEDPSFAAYALSKFTPSDVLAFFHSLGLLTVEEYGGRVYPLSDSANSVLDVMRFALEARGVELICSKEVRGLKPVGSKWSVSGEGFEMLADKVIVACGGMAGAKLGGTDEGYKLLKSLGHRRSSLYPSLCRLITAPEYPRALKGVRADCILRLISREGPLAQSRGELQFTDKGLSGPAAYDLSRTATTAHANGAWVSADLLADYSDAQLVSFLKARRKLMPTLPCSDILTGMLHNRLGRMMVKYAGLNANAPLSDISDKELEKLSHACKGFELPLQGLDSFDNAQVTAGGILTSCFNPKTLESLKTPGLFACGELLDIDGDCGGYNLQWAWASGHLAGRLGR